MKNRITSLFELDTQISTAWNPRFGPTRENGARKSGRAKKARKGRCAPHTSVSTQPRGYAPPSVAQGFDKGDPIRCEHSVSYRPVAPVDMQEPAPPTAVTPMSLQLGDEYDVEAFEEPDEQSTLRLSDTEEEVREAVSESYSVEDSYVAQPTRSEETDAIEQRDSGTFAAEMLAVEQDLADLATRASQPPAPATPDTAPSPEEAADGAPPGESAARKSGHGVFDQMAQGMGYSTEFRLPAVHLSQVFSALDKQLDAEHGQKQVTPAPPYAPTADAPSAPTDTPLPGNETLIKDLVAMPGAQPTAAPVQASEVLQSGITE